MLWICADYHFVMSSYSLTIMEDEEEVEAADEVTLSLLVDTQTHINQVCEISICKHFPLLLICFLSCYIANPLPANVLPCWENGSIKGK